jgi:hypothetical protein
MLATLSVGMRLMGVLLVAAATMIGCKDMGTDPAQPAEATPAQPSPNPAVSFSQNVKPIFNSPTVGCLGCHGGTSGLIVGTVANLLKGGVHGPAVVPGNSAQSLLIRKLSATPPFGARMPFGGAPLPDSTIQIIKSWIDQGALDN